MTRKSVRHAVWRGTVVAGLVVAGVGAQAQAQSPAAPPSGVAAVAPERVVYHISDSGQQALAGLRNLRNHLDVDPSAQIIVVTHGLGVDFLMEGAQDPSGLRYESLVADLHARGVRFEVCEITLRNRGLKASQFMQEADYTPSGVVRLSRLQHQGYAYVKP